VPYLGIKDYIASPKPNGYQSIHTRVFGPQGRIVEVQIRSQKMHEEAEMGITAHWMYSQLKAKGTSKSKFENFVVPEKLKWVQQLVTWQESVSDNDEFMRSLKLDTFQDRILVFTPIGDVYDLPIKSSPIDFAYAVHTDLGHQAHGAKINGKLVSLNTPLSNGDVVEILVDRKRKHPSHEWLDFVVTNTARREITKALKA
jgi:GTP pyrophosphokinase